jgi:hypothetical protein
MSSSSRQVCLHSIDVVPDAILGNLVDSNTLSSPRSKDGKMETSPVRPAISVVRFIFVGGYVPGDAMVWWSCSDLGTWCVSLRV